MDLWTELNFGAGWELDLLDQQNGLFGDHKQGSRLWGDMDPARPPRDAVEQPVSSPNEDPLDHEWMESNDLSSFLESLDDGQDKLLPQENSLFDCSQELALKDNIAKVKSLETQFVIQDGTPFVITPPESPFVITPPESPEQVAPVIKLDPELNSSIWSSEDHVQIITPPLSCEGVSFSTQDLTSPQPIYDDTPIHDSLLEMVAPKPDLFVDSDSELIRLAFTSDFECVLTQNESLEQEDVEIVCTSTEQPSSFPSPPETSRPSIDTLIQSSPELYKVIATPSDVSARFSPYKISETDQSKGSSSKSRKSKRSSELISEVVTNNLGKKERKKIQNKNAAIRYRQKKKIEVESIIGEVQGLEDKNQELKSTVDDLQREIKYMKNLMEDIYKAKGLAK